MYFCFIDESGTPPKPSAKNPRPYFVIGGIIIHESQWHEIAKELRQLRHREGFQVFGEIKWRYFGGQNDDPDNTFTRLLSREAGPVQAIDVSDFDEAKKCEDYLLRYQRKSCVPAEICP
jgi:hypothetical protein